ncbi:MAG: VIT1/CCC1 transporter family protein [Candidatus Thermoplasmatota archaeon]|nr:VIT1/CCC1 transporter family protein [Candidatus Thermoplasmatota archaeon]
MTPKAISPLQKELFQDQQNEIDAYHIYSTLANKTTKKHNKKILNSIAADEQNHYNLIKEYTKTDLKPNKKKIFFYIILARLLGFTFALKLLENAEQKAQDTYKKIGDSFPQLKQITRDEEDHERKLINMMNEDRLEYVGSVVLGLNDALVELTGALAGFTFALQNARIIGILGLITGISASLSMGASEYLSASHEHHKNAGKAAGYTATAYVVTVFLLILPFMLSSDAFISLVTTLGIAIVIIAMFNYYIAIAKDFSFKKRFMEMAGISLGVAAISFLIGVLVKSTLGVGL